MQANAFMSSGVTATGASQASGESAPAATLLSDMHLMAGTSTIAGPQVESLTTDPGTAAPNAAPASVQNAPVQTASVQTASAPQVHDPAHASGSDSPDHPLWSGGHGWPGGGQDHGDSGHASGGGDPGPAEAPSLETHLAQLHDAGGWLV